jgi:hypothetical protein
LKLAVGDHRELRAVITQTQCRRRQQHPAPRPQPHAS